MNVEMNVVSCLVYYDNDVALSNLHIKLSNSKCTKKFTVIISC